MPKLNEILKNVGNSISNVPVSLSNFFSPKVTAPSVPTVPVENKYILKDRGVPVTDSEFNSIRPIIYGEVSNRDTSKKKLEANVILNTIFNRAKEYSDRGTPKKLSEIVAMPNQYQAYQGNQYNQYSNPSDSVSLAKKKEVDSIMDEIYNEIKAGTFKDITGGAAFYTHLPDGKIKYNQKSLFSKK